MKRFKKFKLNKIGALLALGVLVFLPIFADYNVAQAAPTLSFSPSSGTAGDLVKIYILGVPSASNNGVFFGTLQANVVSASMATRIQAEIDVTVPNGATTGKINVKTTSNGTLTSSTDFVVNTALTPSDLKYYYLNNFSKYVGPYDTPTACQLALASDKLAAGGTYSSSFGSCSQMSTEQVQNSSNYSPVYDMTPVQDNSNANEVYKLLAPIGDLKQIQTSGGTCPGNPSVSSGIGCYLNIVFKTAIGLASALAVIMIVIGGIQYMGTESIFGKTEAKSRIMSAILGLLIALGAYALLNTINPALTGANGVTVDQVMLSLTPGEDGLGTTAQSTTTLANGTVQQHVTLNLKGGGSVVVTACDPTNMAQVTAFGTTFMLEKNLLPSVKRIDAEWRQMNPAYKIPMTVTDAKEMGGYNCRDINGKTKLSWHAYGLAVDINPASNPAGSTLVTNMPPAFVQLWKSEGWGWGGNWSSSKDAMHFSKGSNEGGDMTGE